ncbi:MAG: hypothetical protein U1A78_02380 [Polyangia bacterium]
MGPLAELRVHRVQNPGTDCEYAYLVTPADRSVLLSLGSYSLSLEFKMPRSGEDWLTEDYEPTDELVTIDLAGLRYLLDLTFPGGVEFVLAQYEEDLSVSCIELSLTTQKRAEDGPEYVRRPDGAFERLYREPDRRRPISTNEEILLKAWATVFTTLATEKPHLIGALPTPRFRRLGYPDRERLPI